MPLPGTHIRIAPTFSRSAVENVDIAAGVVDNDYLDISVLQSIVEV